MKSQKHRKLMQQFCPGTLVDSGGWSQVMWPNPGPDFSSDIEGTVAFKSTDMGLVIACLYTEYDGGMVELMVASSSGCIGWVSAKYVYVRELAP